jgi:hypothetical protein
MKLQGNNLFAAVTALTALGFMQIGYVNWSLALQVSIDMIDQI